MNSNTATQNPTTATPWQIDPTHTQVEFQVKHMMFARVRGRFDGVQGTIVAGPTDDVAASEVDVVIDAASINTGQAQRDEHLRSADFLDAETFPEIRFRSESVRKSEEGDLTLTGVLTIRDVTRSVDLTVAESGRGVDPWGNQRAGFTASGKIDRRDFGLTWNQALETGGVLVGNEVVISIEVEAVLQDG